MCLATRQRYTVRELNMRAVLLVLSLAACGSAAPPGPTACSAARMRGGPPPDSTYCADAAGTPDGPATLRYLARQQYVQLDGRYCHGEPCGDWSARLEDGTRVAAWSGAPPRRTFVAPGWEMLALPPPGPPKPLTALGAASYAGVRVVPITVLDKNLLSGERSISLPPAIKEQFYGKSAVVTQMLKLCVSNAGVPEVVETIKSSHVAGLDGYVEERMKDWRYRPYLEDDRPVPVCTAIMFQWIIEKPAGRRR
jgi:hypothetical protein